MSYTAILVVAVQSQKSLVIWRDPERTLRVAPDDLDASLRSLASTGRPDHKRLIALMISRPEDWQIHALVRAEIARSGDVSFAKQAMRTAEQNTQRFMPSYPHWRTRKVYEGSLAYACYRMAERGVLSVDRPLMHVWSQAGQDALLAKVQDVRSVEEAYLVLSVYRDNPFRINEARTYLEGCIKRFGPDAGLAVYTARLYELAATAGWKFPLDGRGKAIPNPSIKADAKPERERQGALDAYRLAPKDPGVLAVASSFLSLLGDPRATSVFNAYIKSNDPEEDRLAKVGQIYAAYLKRRTS